MAETKASLWTQIVAELTGANEIDPYLEQAKGELVEDSILEITVPSEWTRGTIERRHLERIREALHGRFPAQSFEIRIIVDEMFRATPPRSEHEEENAPEAPTEIAPDNFRREQHPRILPASEQDRPGNLNPRYTFDRFVVGSSNRFACAAALSVAENPDGKSINPLFIYGGVGLGKTHLLHAIGNLVRARHPHLKVLYVSAETFTNDMVEAIRFSATNVMRNKYRTIDILLMDDVQFLQKKVQSQIEFVHTFNELHIANKQIVLASDSSPQDIPELEGRLKSRFDQGVTASIDPPEVETRIAILQRKAEDTGIQSLPDDVALYIAEHAATNIRELEGTLATVYRYALLHQRDLTIGLVREVLRSDEDRGSSLHEPLTVDAIQRAVADFFHIKTAELKSKRRTKRIATIRHIAMYLCRHLTDLSLVDIGGDFGGRDHSTVISACAKIEGEIQRNPELAQIVQELTQQIRGKRHRSR